MKRALTVLSVCLILVGMSTTVQAQGFTPSSSNLIAHEYNALGLDGNENRYLFTSYGIQHLSLYMVSPDTLWEQIGLVATPGLSTEGAYRVFDGDDGFVIAEGDLGVSIVDVWNLGANFYTVSADVGGACTHVTNEIEDSSRVYCAVEGVGIVALEVPDSSTISVLGTYSDPELVVHDLKYREGYLYVAADTAGLLLIDVSDPANPSYYSEWDYDGVSMLGFDFHPAYDSAYVALGNPGVVTIDISDPSNPTLAGGLISTAGPALDIATYTVVSGINSYYYLVIAEGNAGFQIFYDEIPGGQASSGATRAYCNSVYVQGNAAFFFEGVNGFEIWDVAAAYSPSYLWHHVTPGGARAIAIDGDYAYVANFNAGMTVLDLTDPANPDSVDTDAAEEEYWDVLVNGIYAYALDKVGGLFVYDLTDPANPAPGTYAQGPPGFRSMDVWGDSIYIGSYYGEGVHIVDISIPDTPVIGDTVDVPFDVEGVTAADGRLYVAANDGGVLVYEIMAPSAPAYLGEYVTTGNAKMVAANGNTIYVAAGDEGVLVLDVTDPGTSIGLLATITLSGDAQGVTFANDVLYIAHTTSGVSSYDVSTPDAPILIGTYDSPGMAYEVALYGTDYAYLADGYSVEVYDLTAAGIITSDPAVRPTSFTINGNYPNPFNASTVLSFSLPVPGQVSVEVFDMMGRLVANLYDGNLGIGEHRLYWNADTFTSGLYFAKVSSPLGQKVQKMVLLK